jgi:polar amino acid transport system substrate-binding protein
MMKRLLVSGIAALATAFLLSPVSAEARDIDDIIKAGVIKIGVHPNGPPRSALDTKGEWSGYDIDIGNEIARMLGVKAEFVATETPQRIPNLLSDVTDISLGALTRTPDRAKVIDYTVPLHTESMATLTTDKYASATSWKDFDKPGMKAVDCRGCRPGEWVKANMKNVELLLVESGADSVRALAQGRADFIVENLDFYGEYMKQYPNVKWRILPDVIQTFYCGIGVKRGNNGLKYWLNVALYDMQVRNFHGQAWEKNFGTPQVAPVVPQPYF